MKKIIARVLVGLIALAFYGFVFGGNWSNIGSVNVSAASDKSTDRSSRPEDIQGELEVVVEDGKASWQTLYFLKTAGKKISLHFAKRPEQNLQTGMKVRVHGVRNGDELTADDVITEDISGGSVMTNSQSAAATLANTTGEHKVLVILVNFQDDQSQPYTVAEAQDAAFNTTSNYYRENSYGQTWLTGDVYGWYTIPVSSTTCDTTAIANYAQQAAVNAGAKLSAYQHIVYAFPANACTFSGRGSIGGSPSQAWINGWFELGVLGHELGHNFGLNHSRSMDCGTVAIGGTCTVDEYGDDLDLMGGSSTAHFNSYQKERLGWLNSGISPPIQTVTASGTYFIDAYENNGTSPKALKVLKSYDPTTGTHTWYYIEIRTPTGFDTTTLPDPTLLNGVAIHTGSDTNPQDIYLLDMTPATASWYDAALMPGQSFSDLAAGVGITTVSAGSSGAWVQISVNGQPCSHVNPTLSVSPSRSGWLVSGASYTYAASITNNDAAGCSAADFNVRASVPSGWSVNSATLNLAPGATTSVPITVTSVVGTSDGNYGVGLSVSNASDSTRTASASATYTIATRLNVVDTPSSTKYSRTQKATVTATVSVLGSPVANATVSFSMTKPDGSVVTQSAVTGANGVATFIYSFNKRTDPTGTYRVTSNSNASGLGGTGSTSFSVTR